uniref:hypothetical protein n=1 Tax=Streptomyces sp. JH010 TaxID=2763535 RepID=UPI0023F82543|nr:hypothetical protein [Streptomyces sp. JH010]
MASIFASPGPHTLRALELTDQITAELTVLVGFDQDLAAEGWMLNDGQDRRFVQPAIPRYLAPLALLNINDVYSWRLLVIEDGRRLSLPP